MPSKGVDYYSYIALPNTSIAFAGPDVGSTLTSADNFMKSHLEIDSGNLPWFTFTGTFDWDIDRNGMSICERQQEINSLTGNLESGDFTFMMNTPAVLGPDYTVTYGFYDAGSGIAGLTNADQSWVTIVPKFSDWMGDVAPPNSSQEQQPFSTFVLAAAHDGGMNTMSGIDVVTSDPVFQTFIGALSLLIPVPGIATLLVSDAVHIMEDLAMTQKDTFTSMLDNGVRYFDFRPAYLLQAVQDIVPPMNNSLYHTHLVIPGARFDAFLSEVVSFLIAHPTEVVVTRISADGIQGVDIPDAATVSQFANTAVNGTNVLVGDSSCFQMPIGALRASGKRLILVQNNPKYDSYSDAAYATLDPTPIIESFANMSTAGQAGNDFTVLQLQGTSTGITDVLIYGALIANGSTSTLMATKAQFDMVTLPWVRENALGNLTAQQNIILMNDFIDGATTHTALEMSQARFAGQATVPSVVSTFTPVNIAARAKLVRAQEDLGKYKKREGLLESVVAKAYPSDEERTGMRIIREAAKEAQDSVKAQATVTNLAKQRVAATESATAKPSSSTTTTKQLVESKSPEHQVVSAQKLLEENKSKETMLLSIVAKHTALLNAKGDVADEEIRALAVMKMTQKEAEDIRSAQEEVLKLAKKRTDGSR